MVRSVAGLLLVGLLGALVGCGSGAPHAAGARVVDEQAIAAELHRELPGTEDNAAFHVQVLTIVDLCRSTAADLRINSTYAATPDQQSDLRRQINAGCPWRLQDLDRLLATQRRPGGGS